MNDLKVTHHYQNQRFNNIHEFFWGFGSSFHTIYAVVPLFLKKLGAPEVIATSSAGIFSIIIALPMLITAALTRNITNTKRLVIGVHCIILFVAFVMGYVFTFSDIIKNPNAWKIYFMLFIAYSLAIGTIIPIWADFLEKTTNRSLRGKFFGIGFAFNGKSFKSKAPQKEKITYLNNLIQTELSKLPEADRDMFKGYDHYFNLRKEKAKKSMIEMGLDKQYADSAWDYFAGSATGTIQGAFHDPIVLATLPL